MLTLVQVVHLGGLSALTRNLLYRYVRKQIPQRRVWVSSCTFGGKQAQTATLKTDGTASALSRAPHFSRTLHGNSKKARTIVEGRRFSAA